MGFAELRRASGVEDSGRFNYHLDRPFVRRDEEGYRPTWPGIRLTGLVSAGTIHADGPDLVGTVPSICPTCDRESQLRYEEGVVKVTCSNEEHEQTFQWPFPPSAVGERSVEAVFEAAAADIRHQMEQIRTGLCPLCRAPVDHTVSTEAADSSGLDSDTYVTVSCHTCSFGGVFPVRVRLCPGGDVL